MIPGTVYRVNRVLGAGGMGTVYEVEDTTVGRRYVLKTLHGDLADRPDLAARLSREARALAKLQHANIVEVYTSGTTQDRLRLPFYVMELLKGQSLREVLRRKGRLTLEQAYDIEIDLLDALDHAHESGIVHRDVKPDNIFITREHDGRQIAKLLDFGIIKLVGKGATFNTGHFIGTFRYAAPEQVLERDVTARSDLYSAALVLYEMLAGQGPFADVMTEPELAQAQVRTPAPPLSRFVAIPPALDALIASALSKDPEGRPRDAYTFGQQLRELRRELRTPGPDAHDKPTVAGVVSARTWGADNTNMPKRGIDDTRPGGLPTTRVDDSTRIDDAPPMNGTLVSTALPATPVMAVTPPPAEPTRASFGSTLPLSARQPALDAVVRGRGPMTAPEPSVEVSIHSEPMPLVVRPSPALPRPDPRRETTTVSTRPRSSLVTIVATVAATLAVIAIGLGAWIVFKGQGDSATVSSSRTPATAAPTVLPSAPTVASSVTTSPRIEIAPPTATVSAAPKTTAAPSSQGTSRSPHATTTAPVTTASATTVPLATAPPTATASASPPVPTATTHRPGSGL